MIIDDLPSISIANDSDEIAIEQGTATKKITKGNFLQEVTSAISSLLSSLSGKVSKAGDTMTGDLTFSSGKRINVNSTIDQSTAPSSNKVASVARVLDKNNAEIGQIVAIERTNGNIGLRIMPSRTVNGADVYNNLELAVDSSGNRIVTVSDAAPWRTALGLEAVEFNLTRASAVSNGSGYGIYDPGSKTVRINGWARNDTDITTGAAVFTIPSEYRPSSNKYGSAIIINSSGVAMVYTIGVNASGSIYQSYTNTARQIKFYIEYKL